MFTPEEQLNNEINENIYNEVKFELNQKIRESIIDWSREFGDRFTFATISALSGNYDDLLKDIARNKITTRDAEKILSKLLEQKIINQQVFNFQLEKIIKG